MNDQTKEKMKKIITETLETFGKNYAKATKSVICEAKEDEIKKREEEEEDAEKKLKKQKHYWEKNHEGEEFPGIPEGEPKEKEATYAQIEQYQIILYKTGLKARRPRPKGNKSKPVPKIVCKISYYKLLDTDTDPYCVYYIKAYLGKKESSIYHRYSDFKDLNKKLKKILTKNIKLPEKSSAFGKRNLTDEFLRDRVANLNIYLEQISEIEGIESNQDFLSFLDLSEPENEYERPIFKEALENTKKDINSWGELIYSSEGEGIAKLIIGKIHRELWSEIDQAIQKMPGPMRKTGLKAVYKVINTSINATVPPGWTAIYNASKPVKDAAMKAMETLIGKILELKKNITDKLNEGMAEAIKPIKETISDVLKRVFAEIIPLIFKILSPIFKLFSEIIEPSILKAIDQNDKDEIDEIGGYFTKKAEDIKGKLQEALDNVVDDICKGITIPLDALIDLFSPIKALSKIISGLLDMFDPDNFVKVFKELLKQRDELKNFSSISDPELRTKLDKIESNIKWEIWRNGLNIGYGACRARNYLYTFPNIGSLPEKIYDVGDTIKKDLHKAVLKHFAMRFTDHVWEATIDQNNTPWETVVDVAFKNGYVSAKKKFFHNIGDIITGLINNILSDVVIDKVLEKIKSAIESIVEPIDNAIPDALKDFVTVSDILNDCVEKTLTDTIEDIIDDQRELFANEFNNAIA